MKLARDAAAAALALSLTAGLAGAKEAPAVSAPPVTRVGEVKETLHGVEIVDPYRWLEDQNSPETRAWIDVQTAYMHRYLDPVPGRDAVRARLAQLLKVDAQGVPGEHGGRYFSTRRAADQDLNITYVRRGLDGKDEVLLDPHPLSPDHGTNYTTLDITPDGRTIAFGTRLGGQDETDLHLMDVDTRKVLADSLPRMRFLGVAVKPDRSGIYYARFTKEGTTRVFYHASGTDPAKDAMVFGDGRGPEQIATVSISEDGRWLLVVVYYGSAGTRTEVWAQDLAGGGKLFPVVNDLVATFSPVVVGDVMFLQTNWDAPNGKVLNVDLKHPERANWRTIVPEGDAVIEGISTAGGRLFVRYLRNVASELRVFDADGKSQGAIALPTLGTAGDLTGLWDGTTAFYSFQSFLVPSTIYRYDVATGKSTVWWRQQVPVRSENFETKQVWFTSKDGTRVPMFLVHRKGLKFDGARPTYLTGYGGFNSAETPFFTSTAVLMAEHDGVFVLVNLRGGSEFGEAWHKAGMLDKKQNVFDDFTAAAQWLIANRVTNSSKLAISGGSNGGLLVGAALTQHPELYRAVVCSVPLLDMVRYHQFKVARFWTPEYGSSEDSAQFHFLYAYSPYHHVKKGVRYPSVLMVSGDNDTRVDPLHARKMTALLQAATSGGPVLLHYDTKSGHAAGKSVTMDIDDRTDTFTYLLWQLGMSGTPATLDARPAAKSGGE